MPCETPLNVFVMSDCVLNIPIDGLLPASDVFKPSPADLMMAEGGVAFEDGTAAAKAYPGLWGTAGAAKIAFMRAKEESSVTFPYRSLIRECNPAFAVRFKRAGNGQKVGRAVVHGGRVPDPRAGIERLLGPLSMFEMVEGVSAGLSVAAE